MFENICTLPLTSELFSQALHPTLPILSVGLSAGHVQTFKLPDPSASSESSSPDPPTEPIDNGDPSHIGLPRRSSLRRTSSASAASDSGLGEIETAWRTKRHKGSCRTIAFSPDGSTLFSAGTDGLVKAARSEDGRVISKIAIRPDENGDPDPPTHLHILTPQLLILATDSSAVHLHDLRLPSSTISSIPSATYHPHPSFLSSLTPLPASDTSTSGLPKQFVSTGGTTLAITDIRRGVLVQSSDQEEELSSSVFVSGLKRGGTSKGEKVVVGGSDGVLTLWERGVWDDQDERIILDRGGEGVESLTAIPDNAVERAQGEQKLFAAGLGDGRIKFVRLGPNKVVHEWDLRHDDLEGVVALGFDVGGRMVSGGGETVKVWREAMALPNPWILNGSGKRPLDLDGGDEENDDEDEDGADDDSEDEESSVPPTKRRKRKRGRGKDHTGGQQIFGGFKGLV